MRALAGVTAPWLAALRKPGDRRRVSRWSGRPGDASTLPAGRCARAPWLRSMSSRCPRRRPGARRLLGDSSCATSQGHRSPAAARHRGSATGAGWSDTDGAGRGWIAEAVAVAVEFGTKSADMAGAQDRGGCRSNGRAAPVGPSSHSTRTPPLSRSGPRNPRRWGLRSEVHSGDPGWELRRDVAWTRPWRGGAVGSAEATCPPVRTRCNEPDAAKTTPRPTPSALGPRAPGTPPALPPPSSRHSFSCVLAIPAPRRPLDGRSARAP